MKKLIVFAVALLLAVSSAFSKEKQIVIHVKNPLKLDRPAAVVSVQWKELKLRLPSLDPDRIAIQETSSKNDVTFQVVDDNQDGTPEELVFQSSFKAGESKEFVIKQSTEKPLFKPLTDVRFVPPREDVAWENDRIAFRVYGPPLAKEGSNNGIDIWTKRVRSLIVEKWYAGEEQNPKISYHEDHGEGADYFNVGSSLGDGACALLQGDSLYQPGVFSKYRIIATGPLQAIFELTYSPIVYEGKKITERMRITLSAGLNLNKIDVTFLSESGKGMATFAAGIVKRKGTTTYRDEKSGWTSLWGLTTDKEEVGYLGTGIVMPKTFLKGTKENDIHSLMIGKAEYGKTFTYYAGAGWTRSRDFAIAEDWNKYLSDFARKAQSPLVVSISTK